MTQEMGGGGPGNVLSYSVPVPGGGARTRREEAAVLIAHDEGRSGRGRRVLVELRPASEPLSGEELRRREEELKQLIIKAACRRAARLAEGLGGLDPPDGHAPVRA